MIARNILLLEPGYRNKYPPLGLMKIARYHAEQGKGRDNIVFAKGEHDPKLEESTWDRVYITTLFSFEWKKTEKCIDRAIQLVGGKTRKIFVGGIAASLMTDEFRAIVRWRGIRFIQGLLDGPPAQSLQLKRNDFGHRDVHSTPIEERVPDYSILDQIEYEYPVHDAYFGYASRGCIRKCKFCGVPKLEGEQKVMPPISQFVHGIKELYGEKKDLILMDNNITAAPNFKEIMAEIRDLGFTRGAVLVRNGKPKKRRVDFNQGIDSRILAKNPALLKDISTVCIDPLRIAFDHLGLRKPYEASIRQAADCGITSLSNYMLYNFHDSPEDLYQRLILNIELNEELKVRIWSFPMRYQPVDLKDRSFVGRHWSRYFLRSFQVILQATHGVVSGSPEFFRTAFGGTTDEFMALLLMPHSFIYNRKHFFEGAGREVLDEYRAALAKLNREEIDELAGHLDETQATVPGRAANRKLLYEKIAVDKSMKKSVRDVFRFYFKHRNAKKVVVDSYSNAALVVPAEKKVEDAGLYDEVSRPDVLAVG